MKKHFELFLVVFILLGTLTFVQVLHTAKHDTYCLTEAEWLGTLPSNIRNQLRSQ